MTGYEVSEVDRGQVLPGLEAPGKESVLHPVCDERHGSRFSSREVVELIQVRGDSCWDQSSRCGIIRSSQTFDTF